MDENGAGEYSDDDVVDAHCDGAEEIEESSEEADVGAEEADRLDVDAETCPEIQAALAAELSVYKEQLRKHMNNKKSVTSLACRFCPFRKFSKKVLLMNHVDRYHVPPYFTAETVAARRKNFTQYKVAVSFYRQRLLALAVRSSSLAHDLLVRSAEALRTWNHQVSATEVDVLQKYNGVPAVLVITEHGPQYWLKSQTANVLRASAKTYYTKGLEKVLIAMALQHRGRVSNIFQAMQARWAEDHSACPLLITQKYTWMREILNKVFTDPEGQVQETMRDLKHRACSRGEWVAMSHDATFKMLFSLIGQVKMGQKHGEYHAAHTFKGLSGACPGFSAQRTEDEKSFEEALYKVCTEEMRLQVRFFYSDSPKEYMLRHLPSALGVAEDFLHLVVRCEYCCGGRRTPCTIAILRLQKKFLNPLALHDIGNAVQEVYHGASKADAAGWDDVAVAPEQTPEEMESYMSRPFESHNEYVSQMKKIAENYPLAMQRVNKDSQTMLAVIQAGCAYKHYAYLRNSSIFSAIAQGSPLSGTTANEAEHRSLKNWGAAIYRQHVDRVHVQEQVYGLYKLLGNCHKNTIRDAHKLLSEKDALFLISGIIARDGLAGIGDVVAPHDHAVPTSRLETKKAHVAIDSELHLKRGRIKEARHDANVKQMRLDGKRGKLKLKRRISVKRSQSSADKRSDNAGRPRLTRRNTAEIKRIVDTAFDNVALDVD